ncbi:MAG: 50S ribosomal protein L18 [Candidatus Methanospirareceae archaeon]
MTKAASPTYRVPFCRRREGKTDYRRRRRLLLSRVPRITVRKSNRYIRMQLISDEHDGDNTLISVTSSDLAQFGYAGSCANCAAAYLTGIVFGKRACEHGYEYGILDIGRQTPVHGSNVYAALKGAIDGGMRIPHDPDVFPSTDRLAGQHISALFHDDAYSVQVQATKAAICGIKESEEDKEIE